jgi:hypothetical protein
MAKKLCALLIFLMCWWPSPALAARTLLDVSVTRQADDTTVGVFWFNNRVVWRIRFLSDGAEQAATACSSDTTVVVPDIVSGLFLLKVYNE